MITELSPEEWAGVTAARDAAVRLVTVDGVPCDEFAAAAAVCYAAIGQPAPAVVVAPSPLVALAWSAMIRDGQLYGQLYGSMADEIRKVAD